MTRGRLCNKDRWISPRVVVSQHVLRYGRFRNDTWESCGEFRIESLTDACPQINSVVIGLENCCKHGIVCKYTENGDENKLICHVSSSVQ